MSPPACRPALIALDADNTLWHNEPLFRFTQERFTTLLAPWGDADAVMVRLAPLVLCTKGGLFHHEPQLAASVLGAFFSGVALVSEKTADTYRRAFARHGVAPAQALMAGNSVRSDMLPALAAGAQAVLIPYPLVWAHEAAARPTGHPRFVQVDALGALADWLEARPGAVA